MANAKPQKLGSSSPETPEEQAAEIEAEVNNEPEAADTGLEPGKFVQPPRPKRGSSPRMERDPRTAQPLPNQEYTSLNGNTITRN